MTRLRVPAFDINVQVYGLQAERTESLLATRALFADPSREFGYVAYANGEAVSTTVVILLDGWLYVALVATATGHQKKGYAEAVMRHALQQAATGATRTSLDATDAGAPLYAQLGLHGDRRDLGRVDPQPLFLSAQSAWAAEEAVLRLTGKKAPDWPPSAGLFTAALAWIFAANSQLTFCGGRAA